MPKRSTSLHVPKDMQARFEEITHLTDAFCHTSWIRSMRNSVGN